MGDFVREIAMMSGNVSFGGGEMEPIIAGIVPVAAGSPPWFLVLVVVLALLFIWKKSVENTVSGTSTGSIPTVPSGIATPVATVEVDSSPEGDYRGVDKELPETVTSAEDLDEQPIRRFQVEKVVTTGGDSVIIDEPCQVDGPVGETVLADGRSNDEIATQAQIEQMIADGATPQEISVETGIPVGEIEMISGLQRRRSQEST